MPKKDNLSMDDLLEEGSLSIVVPRRGEVLEGTILSLGESEALIDLGAKAEGLLPYSEVDDVKALRVGARILVYVLTPEDRHGQMLLSAKRAQLVNAWLKLEEALKTGEVLEGELTGFNKGGMMVDVFGLKGFLPFSHFVSGPDSSLSAPQYQSAMDKMRGEKVKVKVLELDASTERVILSEKLAHQEMKRRKEREVLDSLKLGQEVSVLVKEVLPFGLLVDLQGIDALVPKEELSWREDKDQLSQFKRGQEIKAKILEMDQESSGRRPKLSIKRLSADPWLELAKKFNKKKKFKAKVTKITSFGILVELPDGVEGLLPLSELSGDKEVQVGDDLLLKLKAVDEKNRRLELEWGGQK